jgi:hypothetical protein
VLGAELEDAVAPIEAELAVRGAEGCVEARLWLADGGEPAAQR